MDNIHIFMVCHLCAGLYRAIDLKTRRQATQRKPSCENPISRSWETNSHISNDSAQAKHLQEYVEPYNRRRVGQNLQIHVPTFNDGGFLSHHWIQWMDI